MPLPLPLPLPLRRLLLAALLAPCGWAAAAGPADRSDEARAEALQLEVQASALDSRWSGAAPRAAVYLGAGGSGAAIVSVSVAVDGVTISRQFNVEESRALAQGLCLLARPALPAGTHRIEAKVQVQNDGGAEPRTLELDEQRAISDEAAELVLVPRTGLPLGAPGLQLRQAYRSAPPHQHGWHWPHRLPSRDDGLARDGVYRLGDASDPRVGNARFLSASGDYLGAAILLLRMRQESSGTILAAEFHRQLVQALLGYGALPLAEEAYAQAVAAGIGAGQAAELRIGVAQAYYERGELPPAERALGAAPDRKDKAQLAGWRDLKAKILLAGGDYGEAVGLLRAAEAGADFESYVRYYNLGVALVNNGFADQGITVLDRIGAISDTGAQMQALSDRANLVLGAWLVKSGEGATAIPILERVRLRGPYSNRALLDLGWAWLAPPGKVRSRAMLGDERSVGAPPESAWAAHPSLRDDNLYQRYRLGPFVQSKLAGDEGARAGRALAVWSELAQRDPGDESVREGLLAMATLLQHLDARKEAAVYYERAAGALEVEASSLDAAAQYVQEGHWVGELMAKDASASDRSALALGKLPPSAAAAGLGELMAGWDFQSDVDEYRDLQMLISSLDVRANDLDARKPDAAMDSAVSALRDRIARLRDRLHVLQVEDVARLRATLLDRVEAQRRWNDKLRLDTRFQLARLYEGDTVHRP